MASALLTAPLYACEESEDSHSQDFQGHYTKGQMFHGMDLRLQAALTCNEKGVLLNFMTTPGDVDDRKAFVDFNLTRFQ